jgi:hypothetical protein
MKQSEIIMQESLCEESDWKAWSLHFKALREEKWDFFLTYGKRTKEKVLRTMYRR